MVFIKNVENEINGVFVFPLTYAVLYNKEHIIYKKSEEYKKSIKKNIYNEQSAKLFLQSLEQLSFETHNASDNYSRQSNSREKRDDNNIAIVKTVLIPQDHTILEEYINTLKSLDKKNHYNTYAILSKGAPIFGNNGKKAAYEMVNRTINKELNNIGKQFLGMEEYSKNNNRIIKGHSEKTNEIFEEILKITPVFLIINDFIEYGANQETLKDFSLIKTNLERVSNNVQKGIIPSYSNTDKLFNAFYNANVNYGHSYLYPSVGSLSLYKKIELLDQQSMLFWINNWDKEFLYKNNDIHKKELLDIWLEYVQKKNNDLDISVSSINNDLLDIFTKLLDDNENILDIKLDDYNKEESETIIDIKDSFTEIIKDRNIKTIFQILIIKKSVFNIHQDISYLLLYCLAKSIKSPGVFRREGGTKGFFSLVFNTLSVFSYDIQTLEDILVFLGTSDDTPHFSDKEWKNFIINMKESGFTKENGNLSLFASIYISPEKGKNITAKGKITSKKINFINNLK